jgi:AcrR family transcriptional regulator
VRREATRGSGRAAIWEAARRLFAERGYAGTSVRDIAAEAAVDPALVIRYFGSKESLFVEAARAGLEDGLRLDGPLDGLGERLIRDLLTRDEQRGVFLALIRAAETDGIGTQLRRSHEELFVAPFAAGMVGDDAELRARLAAALVGGLFYSLWLVGDESLHGLAREELAHPYGGLLQALITPRG